MLLAPMVEIFCDIDDFCKQYKENKKGKLLKVDGIRKRDRSTQLSTSEIMTIVVFFHLSHYRTFKDFYISCIKEELSPYFPKAVSYERFVALIPRVLEPLTAYVLSKQAKILACITWIQQSLSYVIIGEYIATRFFKGLLKEAIVQ